MIIKNERTVEAYHKIRQQLDTLGVQFRSFITMPQYLKPFLQPGRLVKVNLLLSINIFVEPKSFSMYCFILYDRSRMKRMNTIGVL